MVNFDTHKMVAAHLGVSSTRADMMELEKTLKDTGDIMYHDYWKVFGKVKAATQWRSKLKSLKVTAKIDSFTVPEIGVYIFQHMNSNCHFSDLALQEGPAES